MENLKLTFPSPLPGTELLVETHIEAFSTWLEELPAGNMPRYVKHVADAMANINRTELPIDRKIALIQLLDTAYEKIHNFYRPLMKSGPHKGKHAPKIELAEVYRLTVEMSFAYKIAVYEYIEKKQLFGKNKNLAKAINMALHYLGLVLLEHYELYAPIPMHIWSEIHQLYSAAEHRFLSEESNPINNLGNCFKDVETTYIRLCLISLSNPYHLKRGDHWEVFSYLSHWTKQVIISEDPNDFSEKNCFVINLNDDNKPQSLKHLPDKDTSMIRFLLTDQLTIKLCHNIDLLQMVSKNPKKFFSSNVDPKKAKQLLEDMLSSWESRQDRQAPRYLKVKRMEIVWGLSSIHHVITACDSPQANILEEKRVQSADLIQQDWNTINNSDGGICIGQNQEKISEIDVGLLVAVRQTIADENFNIWMLGIVCWITGNKRNGTQVGIQFLKGDIQAVSLQARKGKKMDTRLQKALLLSAETTLELAMPTLFTSGGLYVESRPMILCIGEEKQSIQAGAQVSASGSIDRFFYQDDAGSKPVIR